MILFLLNSDIMCHHHGYGNPQDDTFQKDPGSWQTSLSSNIPPAMGFTFSEGLDLGGWTGWSLYGTAHLSALSGPQQTGQPLAILSSLAEGGNGGENFHEFQWNKINVTVISILRLIFLTSHYAAQKIFWLQIDNKPFRGLQLLVLQNAKSRCTQTKRS